MTEPDRATVLPYIKAAFPYDWELIYEEMQWSSIDENWIVDYCGMRVGIETDGYIHS
jgi:hypothetical protein